MPDFPIVDSHVHLYDPQQLRYSWMDSQPKLNRLHGIARYDEHCGNVEVDSIVFVEVGADQWGQHIDEAHRIQALAAQEPRLKAIVAAAPLERGDAVEEDLARLLELDALRSIRRLIQDENMPGFCVQPDFIKGVQLLERHDLGFDLCIRHWQMKDAIELARRCPDVRIVLDHIGKPAIKDGITEPWKSEIATLASLPNVCCKLSGVITEADHASWTRAQLRPYLDHAIECFGFKRIMFGSDWPVATLTHEYPEWVAILDEILAGCSDDERRKFYRDNAIEFYRLS